MTDASRPNEQLTVRSLKTFVGAKDFDNSREFYERFGWKFTRANDDLFEGSLNGFSFYLQRYYDEAWCNNMMLFMDVVDAAAWRELADRVIREADFGSAKVKGPSDEGYAVVTHLWDPSGVLWHLAQSK